MHLKRWLTSLIALPILLFILLKGSIFSFMLLMALVSGIAHWEFLAICGLNRTFFEKALSITLGLLLLLSFSTARPYLPSFFLIFGIFSYFLYYLFQYEQFPKLLPELALNGLGLLYIPYLLGHFFWLRQLPQGTFWLLWLLLVIFAGDTGAYYVGRWFGVKKLYPQVSPGKTVAGSVGGLLASLAAGIGFGLWFPLGTHAVILIGLALLAAVIGQFGDLFESMLKRRAQVKDASSILPGHGGLLDRLDSLCFTGAILFYLRLFIS
jgi:phosphatidate cytidylyltransferase